MSKSDAVVNDVLYYVVQSERAPICMAVELKMRSFSSTQEEIEITTLIRKIALNLADHAAIM